MDIRELKSKFIQSREYNTDDVNAIIGFCQESIYSQRD